MLNAHFVGHIPGDLDALIFQPNLSVCGEFGYLLKRSSDRIPANFPTAILLSLMSQRACGAVRPKSHQRLMVAQWARR